MKKFLIHCFTKWSQGPVYSAIAEKEEDLFDLSSELAFEYFENTDGISLVVEELFPDTLSVDITGEMYERAWDDYYLYCGYNITEFDESDDSEDWESYEMVYNELLL